MQALWRVHRWVYGRSDGRIGARFGRHNMLLLTTIGHKSGEPRSVMLTYVADDGGYVVAGSYAGEERDPAWWLNLKANPEATVKIGKDRIPVVAREVEDERRDRLWKRFVEIDGAYAVYQSRTERRIPVVALEPREASP